MSGYTPPAVDLTATDAAIATVDSVVDGIVTDVAAIRTRAIKSTFATFNATNSSSAAFADLGMAITCPATAGKTYYVIWYSCAWDVDDVGNMIGLRLNGDTLGNSNVWYEGPAPQVSEKYSQHQICWGPFVPSEVIHVEWSINLNTKIGRAYGPSALHLFEIP